MLTNTEHCYEALLAKAEDKSLPSRNQHGELIGIDFCQQLTMLTEAQLNQLQEAWGNKRSRALKEKISAQFMTVQLTLLMLVAAVSAWLIGGIVGVITSLVGLIGLFIVIDSKRVTQAKKNLRDAERVYQAIIIANQRSPN